MPSPALQKIVRTNLSFSPKLGFFPQNEHFFLIAPNYSPIWDKNCSFWEVPKMRFFSHYFLQCRGLFFKRRCPYNQYPTFNRESPNQDQCCAPRMLRFFMKYTGTNRENISRQFCIFPEIFLFFLKMGEFSRHFPMIFPSVFV